MLRDLKIKAVYNSEENNILEDFYIPVLKNSVYYDRAVGYFDAKMLTSAASGLSSFIENDGYMRLIVGNTLNDELYSAIKEGYSNREALTQAEHQFEEIIDTNLHSELFLYQLNTLVWLIEHNKLDVKIAFRRNGIHHQKIGIFRDIKDDFIVFQGSANETNNALKPFNYETINVFEGWKDEFRDHFEPHIESFKKLWNNNSRNTLVLNFSDIIKKVFNEKIGTPFTPSAIDEEALWREHFDENVTNDLSVRDIPKVPKKIGPNLFSLRPHQKDALENWKNNGFKGIFELATGAGKTFTAIYAIVKMFESRKRLFTVISVPYQSLADQWKRELNLFSITPIVCYGGERKWKDSLESKILDFEAGIIDFCAVVVVDATLSSENRTFSDFINSLSPKLSNHFLFIGDECHHHGAVAISNVLPRDASLRMGLSATPDRGEEDIGNDRIKSYYGKVIAKYSLKNALEDGVLTPYEYNLVPVILTEEESELYISYSKQISKAYALLKTSNDSPERETSLNILLSKRARIVNGASNKEVELKKLLSSFSKPIKHSLFYCAEGNVEQGDSDEVGLKRIQIISKILLDHGWKTSKFTASEKRQQRSQILNDFKIGKIDSLVAMKCLDEGIDIPVCDTAFILASSRTPRQFIQRRGRILRKSPGKTKAVIYDFFVTIPLDEISEKEIGRKLMAAELRRIREFAHLSINKEKVYDKLEVYLDKYDLHHHMT